MGAGSRPWNRYRTMALGGGSALGFGFGDALDTDRHRMWTDISDTHRLLDVDRHFGYVPGLLDVDRHSYFSSLLLCFIFSLRLCHVSAFVNLQNRF